MHEDEWELVQGDVCPECKKHKLRFIEGVCSDCHANHELVRALQERQLDQLNRQQFAGMSSRKLDRKVKKRYYY